MKKEVRQKVELRLRKVSGQIAGIERMVAEDRYCIDVLQQIAAARSALARVGSMLLESHVQTCVATALSSGDADERQKKIDELLEVYARHGSG